MSVTVVVSCDTPGCGERCALAWDSSLNYLSLSPAHRDPEFPEAAAVVLDGDVALPPGWGVVGKSAFCPEHSP